MHRFQTKILVLALKFIVASSCLLASTSQASPFSAVVDTLTKHNAKMSDLPRYEKLPLFNPHRKTFTCVYQAQRTPPIDPQAEKWFQQALALDNPEIFYRKRDYPEIYRLYTLAAERLHWRAMLNLASLILGNYPGVPEHDPEVAIRWVEKAMTIGVPDAYDVMGVYHQNGIVRGGDATSAFAFFQRAADMGSPSAMTFLGTKMDGTYDDPEGEFWGNVPVATQMLECALAQGNGDAASELGFIYARPETPESKLRALHVLQDGVRLGSAKCANKLFTEFDGMDLNAGTNLVGFIDQARAQRYSKLRDALEFYEGRLKLPNLDKVLPLPPAPLPKWDGEKKSLIEGAKAVTPPPKPQQGAGLQGREFVPDGYAVPPLERSTQATAGDQTVPRAGYWLALYGPELATKAELRPARRGLPERYEAGERFEPSTFDWLADDQVQWHYLGEAYRLPPQRADFLTHMIEVGLLRQVAEPVAKLECRGQQPCPKSGIWEGRVAGDHPLAGLYNHWTQQAFVEKGHAFPNPAARFLDIAATEVRWTYLGSPNEEADLPGVRKITL